MESLKRKIGAKARGSKSRTINIAFVFLQ